MINFYRGIVFLFLLTLCACGGGGTTTSGGSNADSPGVVTISGTVALGIIKDATVKLYTLQNGEKKYQKSTTTDENGWYSITMQGSSYPILIEVSGGTYIDEATGDEITRASTDTIRAMAGNAQSSIQLAVTPMTEIAAIMAEDSPTTTNINNENALVTDIFNFNTFSTQPVKLNRDALDNSTPDQQNYTIALAALSQQAKDDGIPISSVIRQYAFELSLNRALSLATITKFKTGASSFLSGNRNETGINALSTELATFGTITRVITLSTEGTFAAGGFIKAIQVEFILPSGVSIKNADGTPASGVVVLTGDASKDTMPEGFYDPITNTMTLGIMTTPGFGLGSFAKVRCDVSPGYALNTSNPITIVFSRVSGSGDDVINGISIKPSYGSL